MDTPTWKSKQATIFTLGILEAKRWWDLPTLEQFKRYHPRLIAAGTERKRLISVSAADKTYALRRLPVVLDGIGIGFI